MHTAPILERRALLGAALALPLLSIPAVLRAAEPDLSELSDITRRVAAIGVAERQARIARAQGLMRTAGIRRGSRARKD